MESIQKVANEEGLDDNEIRVYEAGKYYLINFIDTKKDCDANCLFLFSQIVGNTFPMCGLDSSLRN